MVTTSHNAAVLPLLRLNNVRTAAFCGVGVVAAAAAAAAALAAAAVEPLKLLRRPH
jgi:hypothetical protein